MEDGWSESTVPLANLSHSILADNVTLKYQLTTFSKMEISLHYLLKYAEKISKLSPNIGHIFNGI